MSKTKPKKERSIQKCLFFFYFKNNHTMSHAAFLKHLHLSTYSTQSKTSSFTPQKVMFCEVKDDVLKGKR